MPTRTIGILILTAALCILPAAVPVPAIASGVLTLTNTVDTYEFTKQQGDIVRFTASASGSGNAPMRVKAQQRWMGILWITITEFDLEPGQSKDRNIVITDMEPGSERVRFRLSRDIWTSTVYWTVTW